METLLIICMEAVVLVLLMKIFGREITLSLTRREILNYVIFFYCITNYS